VRENLNELFQGDKKFKSVILHEFFETINPGNL
jgi:hypothetical protein